MKSRWIAPLTAALLTALAGVAIAGHDHDEGHRRRGPDVAAPANPQYRRECGSCHPAYPPGLLPARSWARLMGTLDRHFGESAELAEPDRRALTEWLTTHAADRVPHRRSRRFAASIPADASPLRVTEVPAFLREHDEIPPRHVRDNPEVRTFARCTACHSRAEDGAFDEDTVRIPGYGRWDD